MKIFPWPRMKNRDGDGIFHKAGKQGRGRDEIDPCPRSHPRSRIDFSPHFCPHPRRGKDFSPMRGGDCHLYSWVCIIFCTHFGGLDLGGLSMFPIPWLDLVQTRKKIDFLPTLFPSHVFLSKFFSTLFSMVQLGLKVLWFMPCKAKQ